MDDQHKNKVTQDDVARYAGVTRSLVSYVLNDNGRSVAPETREKILHAIDVLGYRPNKFAQGLMRGTVDAAADKHIGIILKNSDVMLRPYYAEIIAGIHAAAHENSYHVRFIRFYNDLKNPILFNELIHREEICGLVLVSLDQCISSEDDRRIISMMKERIPNIVCVEWQFEGLSSVNFDRQEAAFKATSHLLEKGFTDIRYIGEPDNREDGFRQACVQHGLNGVESLSVSYASDMPAGFAAARGLFSSGRMPRAIFAGSDEVAIGVLRFLNMQRISVPESVALISIDNIEISEFTNPPLTTINVQKAAMGKQAVNMIMQNGAGQDSNSLSVILPTNMVVRESC